MMLSWGLIFWIISFILLASIAWSAVSLAPWVPTRTRDLKRIMKLFNLPVGATLYDIGCGEGKVVLYASKYYQLNGVGIELAIPFYCIAQLRRWIGRNDTCHFILGDLFKQNLSQADAVYVFGMPKKLQARLVTKLKAELKPKAKVVSCAFQIQGLQPIQVDKPTASDLTLYLYQF